MFAFSEGSTLSKTLRRLKREHFAGTICRAPVAQSVEHRTAIREVVSSTPAGPTLRVLK